MTRPTLLFLSHRLPWPPHNGAAVRSYNIIRQLAQEFDIIALCFDRVDAALADLSVNERVGALERYASCEVFPVEQVHSRARYVWDHLRSVLTSRPYVHYVHQSEGFEEALRCVVAERRVDLVHIDSLDLLRFVPLLRDLPVACNHHNAESDLLLRRADRERGLRATYLRYQARLLSRAEAVLLPRFELNVAVSSVDALRLQDIAPGASFTVVPNGVDDKFFRPAVQGTRAGCVFVGGTTWFPNLDGLQWFSAEILPAMRAARLNGGVKWVGRVTDKQRLEFGQPEIQFTGYVDDIRPHVLEAACFIAPLRVGSGTRLKILDAWAMGTPVVATRIACEGLDAVHGENVLLADEPAAFVQAMSRVMTDRDFAARLGANGRATAEHTYSWDVVGKHLRSTYLDLAGRRRQEIAAA